MRVAGRTRDIGRRIELVSIDPHFHDISIGLYEQGNGKPVWRVHTYSGRPGAGERIRFLARAMKVFGGLESDDNGRLRFPCGARHERAIRRVFLDGCKVAPQNAARVPPLRILDRRSGGEIAAVSLGRGAYELRGAGHPDPGPRRVTAIARGLAKLGEMRTDEHHAGRVSFACGRSHDALVGLLLVRAPNVRAAMREAEAMTARGVLAAPGEQ